MALCPVNYFTADQPILHKTLQPTEFQYTGTTANQMPVNLAGSQLNKVQGHVTGSQMVHAVALSFTLVVPIIFFLKTLFKRLNKEI